MADSKSTKQALAEAMKALMLEKPFQKISISDICERCGMNRKSFYYHFKDKYDLVNWIFYIEFIAAIHVADYHNGWELLADICSYFYAERQFYRRALKIEGQNSFREYFTETVEPFVLMFTTNIFSENEDAIFYITFFGDAYLNAIVRWLTASQVIPPDEFLAKCRKIIVSLAQQSIEELGPSDPQTA